ncbi:MAG: carbohydrate ABC transporter substrate-binding protein [Clostridiales bacterium]|nr:carbohydrate ABC transporter substrate-binding protein [Clostridiales bacterium]
MIRRLISAGLSISMLFGAMAFTGCKKKTQAGVKKIAEDASWFDSTTSELGDVYSDKKMMNCDTNIIGIYHDGLLVRASGTYELPADFDWEKGSTADYQFDDLRYFDADGKLIRSIDLLTVVPANSNYIVEGITIGDECVYLYRSYCDTFHNAEFTYDLAPVDIEKGIIGNFEKMPYTSMDVPSGCFNSWSIGNYLVFCHHENEKGHSLVIYKDGQYKIANLDAAFPSADIWMLTGCMMLSEKEVVLICPYSDITFVSLNLETGKFQNKDEEYSWLNKLAYRESISSFDGESYITDQGGIKRINFETKQLEEVVSFDNCNLNRAVIDELSLFSAKGDKYVFAGRSTYSDSHSKFTFGNGVSVPTLVTLEKAGTNPNVGKVILTAAGIGNAEVSYSICEAIRIFNETNEEYFIQLSYNYDLIGKVDYSNAQTEDEQDDIYYKTAADLNDLLAINMLSGDGPDIILNAGSIRQIQTEKHLVDLNSYVSGKNGINTEDYFSNVIDAATVDGKLLYMPVSFGVSGLSVNKDAIRDGQIGFTYDEYAQYVKEKKNGSDPMVDTQLGVLCTLYSCMSEPCISGNTVNFDNEPFRKMCEYVKNNVPDKYNFNMDMDGNATYAGFDDFLDRNTFYSAMRTLVGYPSSDGSGPYIQVNTSIGISAFAPSTVADGAWEFIKTCLSEEVQKVIVEDHTSPMNKSVFDASAKATLELYNNSEASLDIELDESVIESFKEILQSASVIGIEDPAVLSVIREEMPAYFLDQKTLDAVLGIINNRVTTIINERAGA